MTAQRTSNRTTRLAAVAVLIVFVASACGSGVTALSAETSAEVSPLETAPLESAPDAPGGHEYGATLEQWAEVENGEAKSPNEGNDTPVVSESGHTVIDWPDLIPPGSSGEEVIARFESQLDKVGTGTADAEELYEQIRNEFDPAAVNAELDGQKIRLAGFVAPLTYDGDIITEFLLVPTFGACIHVPPPPPNQTVLVTVDKADGFTVDESWGAVWVEGTLAIDSATTDLADVSYKLNDARSGVYEGF